MRKLVIAISTLVTSLFVGVVPALASGLDYYSYNAAAATDAATAGFLGLTGTGLVIASICACCLPLILDAVLAYVVYTDAKKSHIDNPELWAVIVFFFSVVGLLVYYLIIKQDKMNKPHSGSMEMSEQHHMPEQEEKKESEE